MFFTKDPNLTSIENDPEVKAAVARVLAEGKHEKAARTESALLRNYLEPSADFAEDVSAQQRHEALCRLVGGVTKEEIEAAKRHELARLEEETVRARVKGQLEAAVKEAVRDLLGDLEPALDTCFEVATKLAALQARTGITFEQFGSFLEEGGETRSRTELARLRQWLDS